MPKGHYPRRSEEERFWERVERHGDPDQCQLWLGSVDKKAGYGWFWMRNRSIWAHRAAFILAHGPVPAGLHVGHTCEGRYAPGDFTYRRCCNLAHLVACTVAENHAMLNSTGRRASGERHGSKLHPESILRGDNHPARIDSSYLPRGEDWQRAHPPEGRARGERHGRHTQPHKFGRRERPEEEPCP